MNAWGGLTAKLHGDPGVPMISCSIFDQTYTRALCDLGSSINIMPKVIFEQLQYHVLSQTRMLVQLADSTIRHPEGIVENIYVRVRNCFVLADFVILNMDGDLGLDLILGRPFLNSVKARIDAGSGEVQFRIGVDNIFFKFLHRREQRFVIQQAYDGSPLCGALEPQSEPTTTRSRRRRSKMVWRNVTSSSSSNSPRRAEQWYSQQ
jgi:hypothetical protein